MTAPLLPPLDPGETAVSDVVTHRWAERAAVALPALLAALG